MFILRKQFNIAANKINEIGSSVMINRSLFVS